MRRTRVIPVLLIHQFGVYKSTKFKNHIYIGDPINIIRLFNEMEVDELVILDIDASKKNSEPKYSFLEELVSEAFMPVAYGGGIRTVEQGKRILNIGIEKIIINHAIQSNLALISDCASRFGSQSIVSSIDYKASLLRNRRQYDHVSGKLLNIHPIDAAKLAQERGAGEILFTCVDRDGSMQGLDLELIKDASHLLSIPFVICGGAGTLDHLQHAKSAGAPAIAAGSMFVFRGNQRGILINYPAEAVLSQYLN
jgi:imidazole glycerol-phosphate synthase subunit HisF